MLHSLAVLAPNEMLMLFTASRAVCLFKFIEGKHSAFCVHFDTVLFNSGTLTDGQDSTPSLSYTCRLSCIKQMTSMDKSLWFTGFISTVCANEHLNYTTLKDQSTIYKIKIYNEIKNEHQYNTQRKGQKYSYFSKLIFVYERSNHTAYKEIRSRNNTHYKHI